MVQDLDQVLDGQRRQEISAGAAQVAAGNFEGAETHYMKAWDLLPEPIYDWDCSEITLYRIADFYLKWGKFETALSWANLVFNTNPLPGDGSPYVTIGAIHFEAGHLDAAYENFKKAVSLSKQRVFQGVDKKYFEFYLQRAAKK